MKQNNKENTICKCGHDFNFHSILDNYACHDIYCDCKGFTAQNNKEGIEETITMKEHIEILSKQQDYQFAEGFKQGMREEQLKLEEKNKNKENEFVKNNMLNLIPIAKKLKENEIEKELEILDKAMMKNKGVFGEEEMKNYIKSFYKRVIQSNQKDVLKLIDEIGERFYYHSDIEGVSLKLNELEEYQDFKEEIRKRLEENG